MTDNRTTELRVKRLRELLDERGIEHYDHENGEPLRVLEKAEEPATSWRVDGASYCAVPDGNGTFDVWIDHCTPEQAIAATLGRLKAKSHPYGYERDTGAYDCTRCECGCINDISATYCNDCGGKIEIDESAEKEIYHIPRHLVFAEKHDDGSLELCERRYVPEDAATLGSEPVSRGTLTAEQVLEATYAHSIHADCADADWQAIADELNARAERTCECVAEYAKSPFDGKTIVLHRCSSCHELMRPHMLYCPNCGSKVVVA